jgi:putative redox protein
VTQTLKVTVGDLKGKMHLTGKGHTDALVEIDYPPPMGEDNGFTSLELLMISLASCSCHTIQYVLGTMGMKPEDIRANVTGQRRLDQHPTVLTGIELMYEIRGPGLSKENVEKAINLAKEKFCPVWAMLNKEVTVTWGFKLN